MKTVTLSGSLRENVGKKDARDSRRAGLVPCVLYGGAEQVHFAIDERQFANVVFTPEVAFITIDLGEKKFQAILQDIQYHPVKDNILHADFLEIIEGKEIKLAVPVKITGSSPGVLKGGKLNKRMRKLLVKALPENMIEDITCDISDMNIGDSIKVSDIEIENVTLLDPASNAVVTVKTARGVSEDDLEDGAEEGAGEAAAETPAE